MKKLFLILLLLIALPLSAFAQNDDLNDDVDDDADDDTTDDDIDNDIDDDVDDDASDDDQDVDEELEHKVTIWIHEAVQEDNNVLVTINCEDPNRSITLRRVNRNFSGKPLGDIDLVENVKISDLNPTTLSGVFFGEEKDIFQVQIIDECVPSGSIRYALQNKYEDGSVGRLSTYTVDVTGTSAECGGVEPSDDEDEEDEDSSGICAVAGKNDEATPTLLAIFALGLALMLLKRRS